MIDLDKSIEENRKKQEHLRELIQLRRSDTDMVDGDGYPTDAALWCVENWPWDDQRGWFDFINSIWWMPEWGWTEVDEPGWDDEVEHLIKMSTGGWSGNESVILAMQKNNMLWYLTWVQSRRGGHYIFELKEIK